MWDAEQYGRFAVERARPFHDLVARVGADAPAYVVDLGCGPGALTASLAQRWPRAYVQGVDSSTEMLDAARRWAVPGRVEFTAGDATSWTPDRPVDVLVSNALLQWVPGHLELLPRYAGWLAPGGWLALQVPGNLRDPSHRLLAELRMSPRWREQVGEGADRHLAVADPETYLAALGGCGCVVDAWETTYLHLLPGEDPVLEWMKGTGLRPVLSRLDEPDRSEFVGEYGARLHSAFPAHPWGTVLPFRRIFAVAQAPQR